MSLRRVLAFLGAGLTSVPLPKESNDFRALPDIGRAYIEEILRRERKVV